MSSRSIGVTKVRFSRWMISWVTVSQASSTCLISMPISQAGGSVASIFSSSVAPETMRSARAMKSA